MSGHALAMSAWASVTGGAVDPLPEEVGVAGHGPAVFEERETTCAVGPDCAVAVDGQHNLIIDTDYGGGEVTTR